MKSLRYQDGQDVRLGDIVDVGGGNGPLCCVVVIIPSGDAAHGFNASEWAYLEHGVVFQDLKLFGLLHVDDLDHEYQLKQRAQQVT